MPDTPLAWDDLVRGEVTFQPEHVPDFAILRANGNPLYTLTNPVDDALMEITHVLRGEDLLSSTPRQIALYAALAAIGVGNGTTPRFGHLPTSWARATRSCPSATPRPTRCSTASVASCPRVWSTTWRCWAGPSATTSTSSRAAEMVTRFDVADVNASPARFDLKKCEAINAAWVRRLDPATSPSGS